MKKNELKKFDSTNAKLPKAPKEKKGYLKPSRKQTKARYTNVFNKASQKTPLGIKIRSMLFEMTKDTKYKEKNFQRDTRAGATYSLSEVRDSLKLAKEKKLVNAKKQYKRLVNIQKEQNKITTFTQFRKDNPQFTRSRNDLKKAHATHNKLVKQQIKKRGRKTTFKDFKRANPHLFNPLTGFDTADVESFYDS